MQRKTSSNPTRVYTYRAYFREGSEALKLAEDQWYLAHKYQNKLIEIELARRAKYRQIRAEFHPEVAALEAEAKELSAALETKRGEIKTVRSKARSRVPTPELSAEATELKARRKEVYEKLKKAKLDARKDSSMEESVRAADDESLAKIKEARAASGLYWGTYLLVERNMEAARKEKMDPQFRRWQIDGRIGIQLQGGLSVEKLLSGQDTKLQITPPPPEAWTGNRGQRRQLCRTLGQMRIGSTEKSAPIWTEFALVYHRPLPADGTVKWAWITRRKIGTEVRYELQLTVEAASFITAPKALGLRAAIDLGWRQVDGKFRIGYLVDTAGNTEEILLPKRVIDKLDHVASLRAIRDRNFNAAKDQLVAWMVGHTMPEAFQQTLANLPHWRSTERLSQVVWHWRENRFEGDGDIFEVMDAWRKQDRHLYQWEANERDKTLAYRQDYYRCLAHRLATKYSVINLEDFDLRQIAKKDAPEADQSLNNTARSNRQQAALSEFREALISAAAAQGCRILKLEAAGTTQKCHACGQTEQWDAKVNLRHTCTSCEVEWDQDYNAAQNLLQWMATESVLTNSVAA